MTKVAAAIAESTGMRWSVEQRLEFIDFRLFWDGQVNRSDLVDTFGISVAQASLDLSRYQQLGAENLRYEKSLKTYVVAEHFQPVVRELTARHYLSQLRSVADGVVDASETWLGSVPPYAVVPLVRRRLDSDKLSAVLRAIRQSLAMHVEYQSFSQPGPALRWLTPHALGFDGFRWHVRAWCHEHQDFRDFVLARFLSISGSKPNQVDPSGDLAWQTEITLRIAPHPGMSEGQRRAIELDFGMRNGFVEVATKVCLSYYLERQLGLDLDSKRFSAKRQQIVLLNRAEVDAARERFISSPAAKAARYSQGE